MKKLLGTTQQQLEAEKTALRKRLCTEHDLPETATDAEIFGSMVAKIDRLLNELDSDRPASMAGPKPSAKENLLVTFLKQVDQGLEVFEEEEETDGHKFDVTGLPINSPESTIRRVLERINEVFGRHTPRLMRALVAPEPKEKKLLS